MATPGKSDVTVGIGGDPRELKSAFAESRKLISQFTRQSQSAFAPFTRALTSTFRSVFSLQGAIATLAGTGGFGLLINRSIETADAIGKTADRIGLGVEAYQELRFAAKESGIQVELFNTAMTALARRAGAAVSGNKGFADSFADIGITIEELRSLRPEDLLGRVADGVNRLGSQAERLDALDSVMSEAGRRMVNFTRLGSVGIAQLRQEARDLGIVLDAVMVRDAERAGDQLARVGSILRTNVTRAVLTLTPQIIALAEGFTKWLVPAINRLAQIFPDSWASADELTRRLGVLRGEIEQLSGMSLEGLLQSGDFSQFDRDTRTQLAGLLQDYRELGDLLLERQRKEALVELAVTGSSAATGEASSKVKDLVSSLQFEIDQLGRTEVEQRLYNEAKKAGVEVNDQFRGSIEPLLETLEQERIARERSANQIKFWQDQQAEAAAVFERTRTPLEQFQQQVENLNELLDAGAIKQETYNRAVRLAQDDLAKASEKTKDATRETEKLNREVLSLGQDLLRQNSKDWRDWAASVIESIVRVADTYQQQQQRMKSGGGGGGGSNGDWLTGLINLALGFFGGSDSGLNSAAQNAYKGGAGSYSGPKGVVGPGRAGGGMVVPGKLYPVGEEGPELFAPGVSGNVIPARQSAALMQGMEGGAGGGAGGRTISFAGPMVAVYANNPADMARYTREQLAVDLLSLLKMAERSA